MAEIVLTKENFEAEAIKSELPVLIDFWATWCGPCRMLAPVIEEIATEYDGKVKVCKVNVDEQPELAMRFGVMSIPTLIAFQNGQAAATQIGLAPMDKLEDMTK